MKKQNATAPSDLTGAQPAPAAQSKAFLHEAKRIWLAVPGLIAVVLIILARQNAEACENIFSRGIYPWLSSGVAYLPGFVSVSVAQWVVIFAALLIVIMLIYYINRIVKLKGKRLRSLYRMVMSIIGILSFALFFYTMLCGLNYYRVTFAENEGYVIESSTTEELTTLCNDLVDKMNESRAEIDGSIDSYIAQRGRFNGYAIRSVIEMETLAERFPTLQRPYYSQPKPVTIFSGLMSEADITGMFFAYTVESNVNVDPPFYTIPATMMHELAHQAGYMREDEANFIAYLACVQSGDPLVRYSGYSLAYSYAISALAQIDETAARRVSYGLSNEVLTDRQNSTEFWRSRNGIIRPFAQQANDAYLKANDQPDGTQSYGRVVDLLLAEQRATAANDEADPAVEEQE